MAYRYSAEGKSAAVQAQAIKDGAVESAKSLKEDVNEIVKS